MIVFDKKRLFGIDYTITDYKGLSESISLSVDREESLTVFFTPVHGLMQSQHDELLRVALQQADYVMPDGQPIVWALNYFRKAQLKSRVYGPDLVKSLFEVRESEESLTRVFLYGGSSPQVLADLSNWIHSSYKYVQIVGTYPRAKYG